MQTHLLSEAILPQRGSNAVAAGTTAINGATVDMQATPGCLGVLFVALLGTLTTTHQTKLKAQWSDTNNGSDWADFTTPVETALAGDTDSNKMLTLDVYKPGHRYLRPVLVRGTANAVLDGLLSTPYHPRSMPVPAYGATVSKQARFTEPV